MKIQKKKKMINNKIIKNNSKIILKYWKILTISISFLDWSNDSNSIQEKKTIRNI